MKPAGRPPGQPNYEHSRQYQIKNIQGRQFPVLRELALGILTQKQIAEKYNYTPEQVNNIANSELAKRQINLMRAAIDARTVDIGKHIQEVLPDAIKLLKNVIQGEEADASLSLRVKASQDMLSRGGHGTSVTVNAQHKHMHVTMR